MPYIKHKRVLDVGCFDGYGVQIMDAGARQIIGIDNDRVALKRCMKRKFFAPEGVGFYHRDLEHDLITNLGKFDVITCFEVLEHLEEPESVVSLVPRMLTPGGLFIFSVPHLVENRLHKTLFDKPKVEKLIGRYLNLLELYTFDSKPITGKRCYKGVVDYVGVAKQL